MLYTTCLSLSASAEPLVSDTSSSPTHTTFRRDTNCISSYLLISLFDERYDIYR